ncbi:LuxR C-terminal-related transcriptional regulator [Citrobacter amalonaticus]|nr:LuxR C-terminal-related transcriptional regulator [Citrobacter amalonaticus]
MPHIILTKDVFFNNALSVILQQVPASRKVCVIDIESFRSLGSIFRLLKRNKLIEKHRLIFIGGKDVSSRVLEPIVTIYRKSCFMEFRKQLTDGRTHSPEYALNHIARYRSLSILSVQEKKTLFALLDTDDTWAAARKIYLSPKTVYSYTSRIGQKLNLSSILQVRQFIFSEFVLDAETGEGVTVTH